MMEEAALKSLKSKNWTNIEFQHLSIDGADIAVVLFIVNKSISLKLNIFLTNFLNRRRSQHDVNIV